LLHKERLRLLYVKKLDSLYKEADVALAERG
jgi:hypothetical protein